MKPVKEKGLEELQSFKKRLARSYGLNRIKKGDFEKMNDKVIELIEYVKNLDEEEGVSYSEE
ncbi:MAG: hypothetical protein ACOCUI_02185 [bacterium]